MPTSSRTGETKDKTLLALGKAIRQTRYLAGVNQENLAHDAEINRSYMGKIERAEVNIGVLHLKRIADALHISMADLIARAGL